MVTPVAGSVVLVPFPFSDLSASKLRPALVIASSGHGDWVCVQITSNPYSDLSAIEVGDADFQEGSLNRISYVRPGKLFTANQSLFRRDQSLCLYCGQQFPDFLLSRDHVHPLSQGGQDRWVNVVTACKRCNNHKAGRTPEQAGMELLAIPFCPTHAEYVYLQGRQILNDQMEFLLAHFPRNSVLRRRVERGESLLV